MPANDIDVGPVVVNGPVPIRDVRHVNGNVHESDVLRDGTDMAAQNRFADVADLNKIVISRTDVVSDINITADLAAFIDRFPCGRERCPPDVLVAGAPGNPSRSPLEFLVASGDPDPTDVFEMRP